MRSRSKALARRAARAAIGAIALYNQPNFSYREDAFCILIANAWELLLKAKIIKENNNRVDSIFVLERTRGQRRRTRKMNRAGNPMTISVVKCLEKVRQYRDGIDDVVKLNIQSIIEIRDNATHFMNYEPALSDRVFRIGTASVMNLFKLHERWFGAIDDADFAPLPLAFHGTQYLSVTTPSKGDTKNLVEFLDKNVALEQRDSEFAIAVQLQVTFTKESRGSGVGVRITNDPSAPEVRLSDEDFLARYPLDYDALTRRLRNELPGIIINKKFNELMKELRADPALCHLRFLDPQRETSEKRFYSEAIVARIHRDRGRLNIRA